MNTTGALFMIGMISVEFEKKVCTSVRTALLLLLCEVLLSCIIPVLSTALVLASATTEKKKILLKPVDSHSVPTIF